MKAALAASPTADLRFTFPWTPLGILLYPPPPLHALNGCETFAMHIMHNTAVSLCTCLWVVASGTQLLGEGATELPAGFGMETEVRDESTRQLAARLTTLFVGPMVYDVVHGNPPHLARFNMSDTSVDLIDRKRRVQANIQFSHLLTFQSALEAKARRVERNHELGKFLAEPSFSKEYDATHSKLKLTSPWLTYEADVESEDPDVVRKLTDFADWSARLAGIMSPVSPPPAPRLVLNQELRNRDWRAVRITRTGGPRRVMSSVHRIRRSLTTNDHALVLGIEKDINDFRRVLLAEFLEPAVAAQVARKK